ncbi:hypothetical protein [Actinopolymorpha alba]|uniref:hypothetical protein n=1 Tax=Actinopolymorpha alba TaxID=533267 RepID=UPI00036604B2|nr:hypothetical protein [Actinopolymorpha alba]
MPSADHGRDKRWQVRWRSESGQPLKRNFEKKSAAESFAAEIKTDLDKGTAARDVRRACRFPPP